MLASQALDLCNMTKDKSFALVSLTWQIRARETSPEVKTQTADQTIITKTVTNSKTRMKMAASSRDAEADGAMLTIRDPSAKAKKVTQTHKTLIIPPSDKACKEVVKVVSKVLQVMKKGELKEGHEVGAKKINSKIRSIRSSREWKSLISKITRITTLQHQELGHRDNRSCKLAVLWECHSNQMGVLLPLERIASTLSPQMVHQMATHQVSTRISDNQKHKDYGQM